MLSFEKYPPDLSCEYPQLFKAQNLDLPDQTNLDLLPKQSSLNETPNSSFSIREYVSSSRGKDIKTNWPFSLESLQVCLRHGVKDILPPFEPFNSSRKQCFDSTTTSGLENEEAGKSMEEADGPRHRGPLGLRDKVLSNQVGCVVGSSCETAVENGCPSRQAASVSHSIGSSCETAVENGYPSTQASVSHSKVELVSINRQSSPPTESSAEVEAAKMDRFCCKLVNRARAPTKKGKLIVKVGFNTQRSLSEDIGSCQTGVSETMASKVCPVCKTFSSSSNTTLNAHIDQCLSGGPTLKWTANSALPRHRNKPRKIRLMSDIYKTAKACTLEDLDRRNGSKWASVPTVPAESTDDEEKDDHTVPQPHCEDNGNVGDVYIDANGTKLRILSKSNNLSSASEVQENVRPGKQLEDRKFSLTRKKRLHTEKEKHQKHLKPAHQRKKSRSHVKHNSQVLQDEEKCTGAEGNHERDDGAERSSIQQLSALGTLQQWKGSKRTAFAKKANKSGIEAFRLRLNVPHKLQEEDDQSKLHDNVSFAEKVKKIEYLVKETESNDREQSLGILRTRRHSNKIGDRIISKNPGGNCEASLDDGGHCECTHIPSSATRKAMKFSPASVMNVSRTCTLRNKVSPDNQSSSLKSKSQKVIKSSAFKKSRVNHAEIDDTVAYHEGKPGRMELTKNSSIGSKGGFYLEKEPGRKKSMKKTSFCGGSVDAVRISSRERNIALKSQLPGNCHGGSREKASSVRIYDGFSRNFDGPESARIDYTIYGDNKVESLPQAALVQKSMSIRKFLKHRNTPNSIRSYESCEGLVDEDEEPTGTAEFSLVDHEEFLADNVIHSSDGTNSRGDGERDFEFELRNAHFERDPITIPGPPGSFLPSFRAMGFRDDDFQGNLSMTTKQFKYLQDQHNLINRASSDSQISTTSTVSNPVTCGSEGRHADTSNSDGSIAIQEKINYLGFSCAAIEPPSGDAAPPLCATSKGTEDTSFAGEIKIIKNRDEWRTQGCSDDDQPCFCQRKEKTIQNLSPSYHDSDLLRRLAMSSLAAPFLERQPDNARTNSKLEAVPEVLKMRNCSSLVFEKVIPPVTDVLADANPPRQAFDAGMKLPGVADYSSARQSSSPNTVFRLMGKNLMVVNKDENAPIPFWQAEPYV